MTTHWSVVMRAGGGLASAPAQQALSELVTTYWYPIYAYVRRRGHGVEDAEDLTQRFLVRLMETRFTAGACPEKGRFRAYLLTALKRFLINDWEHRHARKRGGFGTLVPLDVAAAECRLGAEVADGASPDVLFERQWATGLLDRVMARLREEYAGSGRAVLFGQLSGSLAPDEATPTHAEVADRLGLTVAAVKMAAYRLRRRYRDLLREEIARTVESPDDVEPELRHLLATFSR